MSTPPLARLVSSACRKLIGRFGLLAVAVVLALAAQPVAVHDSVALAAPVLPAGCHDGTQPSGAAYRICMPAHWNGTLITFAHGFVSPTEPTGIPEDQLMLPDGTSLPDLVNNLGFAFATSGYRKNGLAILEGVDDMRQLVDVFTRDESRPKKTYIVGASEGGLVTALSIERNPEVYAGGIAACGPVGDFPSQINYMGDVRILFDYYFPGLIPGSPINVPTSVMTNWDAVYTPRITSALLAAPNKLAELMRVAHMPSQGQGASVDADTVVGALWYDVVASNEAIQELGGQPFDNRGRLYYGSSNDVALNRDVQRIAADPAAVRSMIKYQTSGKLKDPLVTLHTTGDPIVPYWQETLYNLKATGNPHFNLPVVRAGHCNFTKADALGAFVILGLLQQP